MAKFVLKSKFRPAGDQPEAIEKLVRGLKEGRRFQTLLGVTGSGKTFTMANVVQRLQKPTLVISHNKTLAAQLAEEFQEFFPDNAVHYFVSYYDYYQPEAYIPQSDTYIEKETQINEEIDRLRHAATQSLLTRDDVLVVASVSCIYGLGSPEEYEKQHIRVAVGDTLSMRALALKLSSLRFERNDVDQKRGSYRIVANHIDITPATSLGEVVRISFGSSGSANKRKSLRKQTQKGNSSTETIIEIVVLDRLTGNIIRKERSADIFPATHYVAPAEQMNEILEEIEYDLQKELKALRAENKILEAARLEQRTNFDLEMIRSVGYCTGIENYSRYFDGRKPGEPAFTLLDYYTHRSGRGRKFSAPTNDSNFLLFVDESHMTIPQIGGMYEGDRSRKDMLVDYGFRMKSAYDNRPLKFEEFEEKIGQTVFVSATPGSYEYETSRLSFQKDSVSKFSARKLALRRSVGDASARSPERSFVLPLAKAGSNKSSQKNFLTASFGSESGVVEQLIRPTGLLEPEVEVRETKNQIENLIGEIEKRVAKKQRVLITTLTKRMAEDLSSFLQEKGLKVAYLHSEVDTLDRLDIIQKLREGFYDCLVGINLLREGLDLPEVSLVAILDADKEGFLRSITSFLQIMGRAARHVEGRVIMYADKMTDSMKYAIVEVERRRKIQKDYNNKHGITPQTIIKQIKKGILAQVNRLDEDAEKRREFIKNLQPMEAEHVLTDLRAQMELASKNWEFEKAARLRDEISAITQKFHPTKSGSKFANIKKAAGSE